MKRLILTLSVLFFASCGQANTGKDDKSTGTDTTKTEVIDLSLKGNLPLTVGCGRSDLQELKCCDVNLTADNVRISCGDINITGTVVEITDEMLKVENVSSNLKQLQHTKKLNIMCFLDGSTGNVKLTAIEIQTTFDFIRIIK